MRARARGDKCWLRTLSGTGLQTSLAGRGQWSSRTPCREPQMSLVRGPHCRCSLSTSSPTNAHRTAESGTDGRRVWREHLGRPGPAKTPWMASRVARLSAPVFVRIGGAFDFHAGLTKQAPGWLWGVEVTLPPSDRAAMSLAAPPDQEPAIRGPRCWPGSGFETILSDMGTLHMQAHSCEQTGGGDMRCSNVSV